MFWGFFFSSLFFFFYCLVLFLEGPGWDPISTPESIPGRCLRKLHLDASLLLLLCLIQGDKGGGGEECVFVGRGRLHPSLHTHTQRERELYTSIYIFSPPPELLLVGEERKKENKFCARKYSQLPPSSGSLSFFLYFPPFFSAFFPLFRRSSPSQPLDQSIPLF